MDSSIPVSAGEKFAKNRELIRLAQGGDEAAAEKLVADNTGLVKSIAQRFCDRGVELEDLVQIGMMGMIKAIRSFELDRGTAFSTYAVPLIMGEIKRYLRDDGIIRVSRQYKRLGAMLMRARNDIMSRENREPRIVELAKICGVSPEEAAVALDSISPIASLSDSIGGEESHTYESVIPDEESARDFEHICDRLSLDTAIGKMPYEWRRIVVLRYYKNMTQQQVADALGLSQVKVSREEKKILLFLRGELGS